MELTSSVNIIKPTKDFQKLEDSQIEQMVNFCVENSLFVATPKMCNIETNKNIFVLGNPIDKDKFMVYYNPKIRTCSEEMILDDEYFLYGNRKYFSAKIKRSKIVEAEFILNDGKKYIETYGGMTSRYFQQGIDLLSDINILENVSLYHREIAKKKHNKLMKEMKEMVS